MTDQELMQNARDMLPRAYAPYSGFSVGAALEAEDGRIFTGCNVENAAYGSSICAERGALLKAVSEGARRFRRIAVIGSGPELCQPCGACRQMLSEFAPSLDVLVGSAQTDEMQKSTLSDLLPYGFGPAQLKEHP